MNVVEIHNLVKEYPKFKLDIDSINIEEGKIVGLIGENGAGKTTLIKAILNIIKVNKGSIKIFGKDYTCEDVKNDIGIVLDNSFFVDMLCPKDINSILNDMYTNWDSDLFKDYLNKFDIPAGQTLKTLSKGMKKKLEIATALAHHPKLLILDEPTSGLDPVVRADILDIFQDLIQDNKHTILLSTHITSDLERIADKIIFIDKGKKIIEDTTSNMEKYGIVKCNEQEFNKLDSKEYISYKQNRNNYEVLVKDKDAFLKKHSTYKVDNALLDDIMVNIIKGGK